jgi:hypothetical protein
MLSNGLMAVLKGNQVAIRMTKSSYNVLVTIERLTLGSEVSWIA